MPYRPLGPCSIHGCPARAVRRGLCEPHALQSDERYRASHPDERPSAAERGYDGAWRKVRAAYLKQHRMCEDESGCDARATDVDHVIPKAQGGTDDWSNLRARCHSHHSQKTNTYDGGFGNPVRAPARGR